MPSFTLHAPRLTWLRVDGVHLYNDGGTVEVDLTRPISAFVGANGIGKSTLLALANFAVTGLVPDEAASFQSVDDFYDATSAFAREYFDGRVDESLREAASVTARFELGDLIVEVVRGLFDGGRVRTFAIDHRDGSDAELASASRADVDEVTYQATVVNASGLASYEQFCFWQLFLMTFDERRHLLFWDEKTLQSALMIALGQSPKDAITAEKLSRAIERKDSLARNARWRATQASGKRSRLIEDSAPSKQMSEDELLALRETNDRLMEEEDALRGKFDATEVELQDASRTLAENAISESLLEAQYLAKFSGSGARRNPLDHPAFRAVLAGHDCEVCGAHASELADQVRALLRDGLCPVCGSRLDSTDHESGEEAELIRLDAELTEARRRVDETRLRIQRLRDASASAASDWRRASDQLAAFLAANSAKLAPSDDAAVLAEVRRYDQEIAEAMRETAEHRRERDEYRSTLEPIIESLANAYAEIETKFVPTFQRLAERFIGRSVDVEFERRGVALRLRFGLDGQTRRASTELSESQQFFVDIALRMSMIETFVDRPSTLLVDTPEGSLDIAYETRAGELFGEFVRGGSCLMLMNNLNSSNLLRKLTSSASGDEMALFKMIEWSRLSDVQLESASLFDEVFGQLVASLDNDSEQH